MTYDTDRRRALQRSQDRDIAFYDTLLDSVRSREEAIRLDKITLATLREAILHRQEELDYLEGEEA